MVNWDEKAKEFGDSEYGAHSDKYLVMLENEFIEKQLKRIKPTNILDIGCGNGQRTKRWSEYASNETVGIDSSEEMIKLATKLENDKLTFYNGNVLDISTLVGSLSEFDVVISARCLINMKSKQDQIKMIYEIAGILKDRGHFICVEGRETGTMMLNIERRKNGIKQLEGLEGNIDLSNVVIDTITSIFEKKEITSLGTYYTITRILTQLESSDIKEVAMKLQVQHGDNLSALGRHFCFCGQIPN
jgi:ubiquinone/menaquinone biosynthesis C-methylase UbiE